MSIYGHAKLCACKGIRSCAICVPSLALEDEKSNQISAIYNNESNKCFVYCDSCHQCVRLNELNRNFFDNFLLANNSIDSGHHLHDCLDKSINNDEFSFHIKGKRPFIKILILMLLF